MNTQNRAGRLAVRAVLVGGDLLFREGLKRLLSDSSVSIDAEVDSLTSALAGLSLATAPDLIILLDQAGQGEALPAGLAALKRHWPGARTVILAGEARAGALAAAIEAGVDGYLFKDVSPEALLQSINLVMLGENVFPARLAAELVRSGHGVSSGRTETARSPTLTGREMDILHGLLAGLSNKAIASQLGITEATVKAQLRHLLRKIGVDNRTQAALWAVERGILRGDQGSQQKLA